MDVYPGFAYLDIPSVITGVYDTQMDICGIAFIFQECSQFMSYREIFYMFHLEDSHFCDIIEMGTGEIMIPPGHANFLLIMSRMARLNSFMRLLYLG